MELITHCPDIERLVSSITRIADNLDQMTEIMTTTSVKVTPEKAKQINTLYGMSVARPLPDWDSELLREELRKTNERFLIAQIDIQDRDEEIQDLDEEIQDLKLENDRLKKREELCKEFLNFFDCHDRTCIRCSQYRPDDDFKCKLVFVNTRHELINEFKKRLEDL